MSSVVELQAFYKHINRETESIKNEAGHFNIFKVEDILLPQHKQVTYSRRSFYKVSLVNGHSKIYYADKTIEVLESVLVFTNPMIPYFWERISDKHSGYVCIFTEDFFNRFGNIKDYPIFQVTDAAVIPLTTADAAKYTVLFAKMFDELQSDYIHKYDLLRNILMEIVHSAQKMQPALGNTSTGSNAAERITGLFTQLLERQFPIELSNQIIQINSPSAFARQMNIHVNHLNKALKETTGKTTTKLINERLLQEAKILLKSTHWSIAEIGWSLGFEEPNHFSSFFKSLAKITPNKFRQLAID